MMTDLLPLFPLHTVLFPGMPVQLQIFETRYKQMLQACMAGDRSFGVVLIKRGAEASGPAAEPHLTGCRALIRKVQPLDEGRIALVALGQERFKLRSIVQEQPYLLGRIEYRSMKIDPEMDLRSQISNLTGGLGRYLQLLNQPGRQAASSFDFPDDPLALAYNACSLLQLPLNEKQALLEMDEMEDLLSALGMTLRRELALMPALLAGSPVDSQGPYSLN
jgi:Lon protease-like protein